MNARDSSLMMSSTAAVTAGLLLGLASCAGSSASASSGSGVNRAPESPGGEPIGPPGTATANLAGSRCKAGICTCRRREGDAREADPPDEDHKRFEIRVGAEGGAAALESPTLGKFNGGGPAESCFYIDVLPGTSHQVTFVAREGKPEAGVSPTMSIAEYGPKGPYWYDVVAVRCSGAGGRCTREAADEWGADARKRRRGRIDPCGSTVITQLAWETSGGMHERDTGFFRDFTVKFNMDVKKFATQFAPGSTECVPK
jgi:hypothetical protein